jgi:hypothetical protein
MTRSTPTETRTPSTTTARRRGAVSHHRAVERLGAQADVVARAARHDEAADGSE